MFKKLVRMLYFKAGSEYKGDFTPDIVRCCHCGEKFAFDVYSCEGYRGKTLCPNCYDRYYGYCNECGELNRYSDMDENIVCGGCQK